MNNSGRYHEKPEVDSRPSLPPGEVSVTATTERLDAVNERLARSLAITAKPTRTAYLVAHIDITVSPPVVSSVGIYSESAVSLTNHWRTNRNADLLSIQSDDFGKAYDEMRRFVETDALMGWVRPLMRRQA